MPCGADDIPAFAFETRNLPGRTNPLGVKGGRGGGGAVGSCPGGHAGTPERLWAAIAEGRPVHM
jgi:aerobic carbon-monoxide dehydrogenase large subunit